MLLTTCSVRVRLFSPANCRRRIVTSNRQTKLRSTTEREAPFDANSEPAQPEEMIPR